MATTQTGGARRAAVAPWPTRVFATWFDLVVLGLPAAVPAVFAVVTAEPVTVGSEDIEPTGAGVVAVWVAVVVYLVIWSWNRYVRQAREGQTVGKRWRGARVLTLTGEVPGAGRLIARDLAHVLDVLPACLGLFWSAWDRRGQTFADKLTGTVVVLN